MALPSAVSVGSLAFVIAAGVGLVAISAGATKQEPAANPATTPALTPGPTSTPPSPRQSTPVAPAQTLHERKDPPPDKRRNPPPAQPDAVPKVLVEVYNNSGVTGLAAQQAAALQSAGWSVAATDNWYGEIPANTVYYPPQLQEEAVQLAKVLGVQRLMPAVAPMQFDRLTVIFVSA